VIICDEPVNGLDPEGIRWIRTLLRSLAAEGRTVFVSSHLMSEMALTADHVIVVGKGRLLADASIGELLAKHTRPATIVRSPDQARLSETIERAGGVAAPADDGAVLISGVSAAEVGELAARNGIVLHELSPVHQSLEAAFLELTRDSAEFRAAVVQS
jgi:ABC-2 type transport system ATP-binding protein